ncbi:MAG: hypothetical protein IJS53_03470 [Clostridia bacterium]|nr:hypothetical protein [Clostridia bacterium]
MAYTRLSGEDGFGWYQGQALTLGGLRPETEYLLLCEEGQQTVTADAQGSARARLSLGAPLCLALQGRLALFNESRITRDAAAALLLARTQPKATAQEAPPEGKAAETDKEAPSVTFRKPADAPPADALPALVWPKGLEELRACFDKNPPVRLLDEAGWRAVRLPGAGARCCVARHATGDRVDGVLYAVQARGSLIPPKGLKGYRFEQLADGGYWVLRTAVREP